MEEGELETAEDMLMQQNDGFVIRGLILAGGMPTQRELPIIKKFLSDVFRQASKYLDDKKNPLAKVWAREHALKTLSEAIFSLSTLKLVWENHKEFFLGESTLTPDWVDGVFRELLPDKKIKIEIVTTTM